MINLIPRKAIRNNLIEYWVRVLTVWLLLISITLFVGAGILLPTYVLINSQVSAYESSAAAASEKVANYEDVSQELIRSTQQAKMVLDESALPVFSEYIDLLQGMQGSEIEITEIRLFRDQAGTAPITVSGEAGNRQALASFRDRLLEHEEIAIVDLPISNLASDSDIMFSLTVTLVNNNSL
jgi:hypothetical protein